MPRNKNLDELKEILKKFSLEEALYLEKQDRQYKALEKLYYGLKQQEDFSDNSLDDYFFKLVGINALLSYQLPLKGEDYWEKFSDYFLKTPLGNLNSFEEFLNKYNWRFLSAKIKRFRKVKPLIENFTFEDWKEFCEKPQKFLNRLSTFLHQKENSKTLVFAVKMLLYACRIVFSRDYIAPKEIFIPLDSRLKKISPEKKFWEELQQEAKVPLLHLDAVIWTTLGKDFNEISKIPNSELREKLKLLKKILSYY
jgi:DNA-(apurinic or apyrimidinic site) lyase